MDLKSAALELAKEGTRVFPLGSDKKPRTSHGFHDATDDLAKIEQWNWNGGGAIGAAIDEGQFVVDVDPRNGGDVTIKSLAEAGCLLPPTRVISTKGGGTHRYYTVPEQLAGRKLRGSLGPGVDIKASGKGYVVVPPSPGYRVKFENEVCEAPSWLLEEIVAPDASSAPASLGSGPKFFSQWEKGTVYGLRAMEGELGRLATSEMGSRNNALNRAAFALAQLHAGGEVDEEESLRRLDYVAEQIGLEPGEIKATVSSGWAAGLQQPREAPIREGVFGGTASGSAAPSTLQPAHPSDPKPFLMEPHLDGSFLGDEFYWLDWQVEEPPPPFYLTPLVPKHAYVIVYGATESSKSMVFLALAAQGSHHGIKSSIYSLENPSHIDRDRIRRLNPEPSNFRMTNQPIDLNDDRQVHSLVERNEAGGGRGSWEDGSGTDWLIIDTYSHAFNSRSEDGNAKAIEFARRVRYIMHKVGCSVILIDHTGYSQTDEPRDASAKRQQVDVAIYMEKIGQWAPGAPSTFAMSNKKSARFGNPFYYKGQILDSPRPDDPRGLELKWIVPSGQDRPTWQ